VVILILISMGRQFEFVKQPLQIVRNLVPVPVLRGNGNDRIEA
jgi:hypothetical protein